MTLLYLVIIFAVVYSTLAISAICALFAINMLSSAIGESMRVRAHNQDVLNKQLFTLGNLVVGAIGDFATSKDKATTLERDKWEHERDVINKLTSGKVEEPEDLQEITNGEELEQAMREFQDEHPEQAKAEEAVS